LERVVIMKRVLIVLVLLNLLWISACDNRLKNDLAEINTRVDNSFLAKAHQSALLQYQQDSRKPIMAFAHFSLSPEAKPDDDPALNNPVNCNIAFSFVADKFDVDGFLVICDGVSYQHPVSNAERDLNKKEEKDHVVFSLEGWPISSDDLGTLEHVKQCKKIGIALLKDGKQISDTFFLFPTKLEEPSEVICYFVYPWPGEEFSPTQSKIRDTSHL
jgi:hypothetical protein